MSNLKPDLGVIDAHLDAILSGEDKWVLTSIEEIPDGTGKDGKPKFKTRTHTRTFSTGQRKEAHAWIAGEQAAERSVYIHYNPMKGRPKSKPPKSAVTGLAWVFVDIDPAPPPEGCADTVAHYAAERARILAQCEEMPEGIPKPTVCVFSGGGYQLAWRLSKPELSDGTAEGIAELERYSRRLEEVFDADDCHNLDRMLRLAGSCNFPNAKKRAEGRVPVMAELCWADGPNADLSLFKKAEPKRASSSSSSNGTAAAVTIDAASVTRFASVDDIKELEDKRWNQCRVVIVQGLDPDDPDKFKGSRSEWLFFVCCEMVRAGCSDDAIYSVITDESFGVSASVLDKGSGIQEYAERQIRRAREEAVDPELAELNAKHTIAMMGGRVRVLTTSMERVPGAEILALKTTPAAPDGMALFYANRLKTWLDADDKPKSMPLWTWWTRQRWSNRAENVVFAPEREVEPGAFNLWHGFAVPPDEGDCKLFLDFVLHRMADGRPDVYEYILDWLALTIQRPWEPVGTALVLYSRMTGTGKNAFVDLSLGLILGHSFLYVTREEHLHGQFSGHLTTTVALHLGEAATADSELAEGLMKALVTDRTRMSERKGIDGVSVDNCLHVVMSSNKDWILRIAPEDRRYCVVDVREERMPREEYVTLRQHMLSGGAAALHAFLAARDISKFDVVKNRPESGAGLRQKAHSVEGLDGVWFDLLQSGELPGVEGCVKREDGSVWVPTTAFLRCVNLDRHPKKQYSPHLLRYLFVGPQGNHKGDGGMGFEPERADARAQKGPSGYVVSPLAEARRRWDERRFPYPWDDDGAGGWIVRGIENVADVYPEEWK